MHPDTPDRHCSAVRTPAGRPGRSRTAALVIVPTLILAMFALVVYVGYAQPSREPMLFLLALAAVVLAWTIGGRTLAGGARLTSCLASAALLPGLVGLGFGSVLLGPELGHTLRSDHVQARVTGVATIDGRVQQPDGTTNGIVERHYRLTRLDTGGPVQVTTADVDLPGVHQGATVDVLVDPQGEREPAFAVSTTPTRSVAIAGGGAALFLLVWVVGALISRRARSGRP